MATIDFSSIGVAAVDVATIQQDVINQVGQNKKKELNEKLQSVECTITNLKNEINKVK